MRFAVMQGAQKGNVIRRVVHRIFVNVVAVNYGIFRGCPANLAGLEFVLSLCSFVSGIIGIDRIVAHPPGPSVSLPPASFTAHGAKPPTPLLDLVVVSLKLFAANYAVSGYTPIPALSHASLRAKAPEAFGYVGRCSVERIAADFTGPVGRIFVAGFARLAPMVAPIFPGAIARELPQGFDLAALGAFLEHSKTPSASGAAVA